MADPELHASAVVLELNDPARGWAVEFTAEQGNRPRLSAQDCRDAPKAFVVGRGEVVTKASRLRLLVTTTVDVAWFKHVADEAAVNVQKDQLKSIARYFADGRRLASRPKAVVLKVERREYFDPDKFDADSVYHSILTLTIAEDE